MMVQKKSLKPFSEVPKDTSGLPYFANFFPFLKDAHGFLQTRKALFGDIYRYKYFGDEIVMLLDKQANKFFLVDQANYLSNYEGWGNTLEELFPNAIMLMDGEQHQTHRNILATAFKKEPMEGYLTLMQPIIQGFFSNLKISSGKATRFFPMYKELTLELAGKVFFGLDLSKDLSLINQSIIQVVKAAMAVPLNLPFTKYGKGIRARKRLVEYFSSIIEEKRANPQKDLFSMLCQAESETGDKLSNQEIIDHLIFILMAGHDTTASTLNSLTYHIAKYPEWQDKIRNEIEAFKAENGDQFNLKDMRKLEILGLAIKETLRLYPPLILLPRVSTKEIEFAGYSFPSGTRFVLALQHNHYNDQIWETPEHFDPMRFSTERKEHQRCPHAYAPFGAGKHHCLGFAFAELQIKLVIMELLQKFELSVPENYKMIMNQVPLQEPKDGLPIYLKIRG